jgi:hypothetical protein
MADWLALGLEEALGDPPELAVVRRNRANSGLIRYEGRTEREDWAQAIREAIAATKPKFIVMMVGLNDRISIRDRVVSAAPVAAPVAPPAAAASKAPASPAAPAPDQPAAAPAPKADAPDSEQTPAEPPAIIASGRNQPAVPPRTYGICSDGAALHTKRIDATIAALKSAGAGVLVACRRSAARSRRAMCNLNDLYARVEKAGIG